MVAAGTTSGDMGGIFSTINRWASRFPTFVPADHFLHGVFT